MAQSTAKRDADRRAVERALRRRGAETCRRELRDALAALDAEGEFTAEQRDALRTFAERLSHSVLAGPLDALAAGDADAADVDPETVAALFEL